MADYAYLQNSFKAVNLGKTVKAMRVDRKENSIKTVSARKTAKETKIGRVPEAGGKLGQYSHGPKGQKVFQDGGDDQLTQNDTKSNKC